MPAYASLECVPTSVGTILDDLYVADNKVPLGALIEPHYKCPRLKHNSTTVISTIKTATS